MMDNQTANRKLTGEHTKMGGDSKLPLLLIDLDGTLYHGKKMIQDADKLIRFLEERGFSYLFVTNNSSRTPEAVAEHLRKLGIAADSERVCTAAQAAAHYIREQQPDGRVYAIGETGLVEALKAAGLRLTDGEEGRPDFVVQGIDREFSYRKLDKAVCFIRNGAASVLTNPDLLLPSDDGLVPGAGSISAAIAAAAQVKPVVIGKPSSMMIDYALSRAGISRNQAWVVGDNMLTDIGAGVQAGCKTVLLLTGITTKQNLPDYIRETGYKPDVVLDDHRHFIAYLNECM